MNLIDEFFLEANPNPDRVGCPPEQIIREMAENRLPLDHPARLHLASCSECFAEYEAFKLEAQQSSRANSVGQAMPPISANHADTAAVTRDASSYLSGIPVAGFVNPESVPPSGQHPGGAASAAQVPAPLHKVGTVHLDLSTRLGASPNSSAAVLFGSLPNQLTNLQITLDSASPAGAYRITLEQAKGWISKTSTSTSGQAVRGDNQVVLMAFADLSSFKSGKARLTLQIVESGVAHVYSVEIIEKR